VPDKIPYDDIGSVTKENRASRSVESGSRGVQCSQPHVIVTAYDNHVNVSRLKLSLLSNHTSSSILVLNLQITSLLFGDFLKSSLLSSGVWWTLDSSPISSQSEK